MNRTEPIVTISGYKFTPLDKIATLRVDLRKQCLDLGLLGTIILSSEGINVALAGTREPIEEFKTALKAYSAFADIRFKENLTDIAPFSRMIVKLKKEIVSMGVDTLTAPAVPNKTIEPKTLKQWLDEGKSFELLDTRNGYEVKIGTFKGAKHLNLDNFRQFPKAIRKYTPEEKQRPIVMFCTGGVRCEKAMPLLEAEGFTNIFQLHGGILQYFAECGGRHWQGECFVFDDRIAVDSACQVTGAKLCQQCQEPVTKQEQQALDFDTHKSCASCL